MMEYMGVVPNLAQSFLHCGSLAWAHWPWESVYNMYLYIDSNALSTKVLQVPACPRSRWPSGAQARQGLVNMQPVETFAPYFWHFLALLPISKYGFNRGRPECDNFVTGCLWRLQFSFNQPLSCLGIMVYLSLYYLHYHHGWLLVDTKII